MSTRDWVVATEGLTTSLGGRVRVGELGLRVAPGRVYALLGPNGAGKSTTLKLLLGLITPDRGRVLLFGREWERDALARVGASIDGPAVYDHLSARQNLEVHARLLGLAPAQVARVLALVELARTGRQRAGEFSTGMRARLALGIALLGEPRLLILDEPTNGLDPAGTVALRAMTRDLVAAGRTVMVTSHQLGEVARVADDVGVLVAGRLRYQGPLGSLAPHGDLEAAYFALVEAASRDAA